MKYCEKEYIVKKETLKYLVGYAFLGFQTSELQLDEGMRIVVLPLEPRRCENKHDLFMATLKIRGIAIPCRFCQECKCFYINQNNLIRWKWSPIIKNFFYDIDLSVKAVPERISHNSDPEWFLLYKKYCDDTYGSIDEYYDFLEKERLKKEKKQLEKEIEIRKQHLKFANKWDEQNRIVRELKIKRGEPLGNLPKQRRRGWFS